MDLKDVTTVEISAGLVDAIRSFPAEREIEHCGAKMTVSPFDIYATCDKCGQQMKLRAFSGVAEIEDVFDAVFEWMIQPSAQATADQRQRQIEADGEE